jgi:DNA recombination protein RmuC
MLIGAFVVVFLLAIAAAIALGLRASKAASESRERDDASRSQLDERLGGLEQKLEQRLGGIEEKVDRRLDGLDGRLLTSQTSANETATQIVERLGKLDGTAAQMLQQATNLSRLEQALRPPKARGGFGEILLGKLLADTLPADAYQLQFTFKSGDRVDAVIKAGVDKLLPVDSKFPLDNFERLIGTDEESERVLHERAFIRDVKGHVDSITTKYVRPAEGTFDFAFMYLPSESVYYELVNGRTGALYAYALDKRVFPVSPSTFHAFMLVIVMGLRGMQIEQHAEEVIAYVGQLSKDFERFRGDFDTVGKHISHAQSKFSDADRRLERLETRLERANEWEAAPELEPVEPPRAIEAA